MYGLVTQSRDACVLHSETRPGKRGRALLKKKKKKGLPTSFKPPNWQRGTFSCVGEMAEFESRTLDTEEERADQCATRPGGAPLILNSGGKI